MSETATDKKIETQTGDAFQKKAVWKSLFLPVLLVVFYLVAPHWYGERLRGLVIQSVEAKQEIPPAEKSRMLEYLARVDFQKVCQGANDDPEDARLGAVMVKAGKVRHFQLLRLGQILSWTLVAMLASVTIALVQLNKKAARSREDLIEALRMGWKLAIAAALAEVLLLVPLLVYACIQLPALLADRIFPNLVLMVVIGGIYAVWRTVAALLKKTPLEFAEPMARELKPEDAPELWNAVREAAARLQTQPPDRILTGLQLNFYVTEMAVRYEGGRTEGRTLFMSYPLLKHLTVEEILAIVGHELGHFIGEDTRMTREFCPLRLKIRGTMLAMAGAGLAGRPSLHLLLFFDWLFSKTESAASRTRELLADQKAAALAGVETAARALVKFHIAAEAFGRGVRQAVESQKGDALEMPVREIIRDNLAGDAGFWKELFDHKAPHPMDSHPPLHDRLQALGQSIDPEQARAMGLEEGESAYSRWFAGRDELFAELKKTAEEAVGKMRAASLVKTANIATPEGRAILDRHFPELKWKDKTSLDFWLVTILLGVMLAPCAILVVVLDNAAARIVAGVILAFLGAVLAGFWMRHRRPELTLNAEGLFYSGWKRPLKFSDIAEIRFRRTSSGVVTLSFRLKTSQPSLWKFPVIPFRRKSAAFNISGLNVKAEEIAQKIFLYYQRLLPGEAPDEGKAE